MDYPHPNPQIESWIYTAAALDWPAQPMIQLYCGKVRHKLTAPTLMLDIIWVRQHAELARTSLEYNDSYSIKKKTGVNEKKAKWALGKTSNIIHLISAAVFPAMFVRFWRFRRSELRVVSSSIIISFKLCTRLLHLLRITGWPQSERHALQVSNKWFSIQPADNNMYVRI